MKSLSNTPLSFRGTPIKDDTGTQLTVASAIEAVLVNSVYENSAQLLRASKILSKINHDDSVLNLEDADFTFVKELVGKYPPILSRGLLFSELIELFEAR